jgi:hypothetical protein
MRRPLAVLCLPLSAAVLAGCASKVSTSSFKGEQREVAQTISNLQSDATAGEQKKICAEDLAASVVTRLGDAKRCEAAIKSQLSEVDSLELSVQSVTVAPNATAATAAVKSVHEGKSRASIISLVKEGGKWKVSSLS